MFLSFKKSFLGSTSLFNYHSQFLAALNKIHQKNCLYSLCSLLPFALKGKQASSSPLIRSSSFQDQDLVLSLSIPMVGFSS